MEPEKCTVPKTKGQTQKNDGLEKDFTLKDQGRLLVSIFGGVSSDFFLGCHGLISQVKDTFFQVGFWTSSLWKSH